ncbi:unnamed protein product [Clonostachys rosea]|uniref:Zn(2)-C6 fungal-type domain-containing protein n=1 Tax=Bionectria ochroleuca TaxID=29856 RepID=A0ABY6TQS1_BIOOC|nr:unnamed protein product [Clonostachys rosea]
MVNRNTIQPSHFHFTPFQSTYHPPYAAPEAHNVTDESSTNRKRIAVACGRCRKRKIRCSGDNGTGEPCLNCRNAGVSPCQFLRVSSLETNMKDNGRSSSFPYEGYSRSYHTRCAEEARARLASQAAGTLPSMYQESGSPTWPHDTICTTSYRSGESSPDKTCPWSSGGFFAALPEQEAGTPSNYNGMYAQTQDIRCQLASFEMAPMKHFSHLNTDPSSYTFTQSPALATSASLVDRNVGSGTHYPVNTVPHGLLPSLMTEKLHLNDTASSTDQHIGTKAEPMGPLGGISTYTKSSPSPTSSLHALTPTTSYGSYTASPGSTYSGIIPGAQADSHHSYNGLPGASSSLPTQFPPPPTSTYVYTDMSATAAAIAAGGNRRLTQASSSPTGQFQGQQDAFADSFSGAERKPPTMDH